MIKSLRARLTLYIVIPVMVALVITGSYAFRSAYEETQKIYDTELSHVANLMLSIFISEEHEEAGHITPTKEARPHGDIVVLGNEIESNSENYQRRIAFRIWKGRELLFYSADAEGFGEKRIEAGYSNQSIGGKEWRLFVLQNAEHDFTLEVAMLSNAREALVKKVLDAIFYPLILLVPLVLALTWLGLKTGLRPLTQLSSEVKHRSSADLTPLDAKLPLEEINPLVKALNTLLSNLKYTLDKERRFTDFAAHELRTPIAVIKTQAQCALRAVDEKQLKSILEDQVVAADRATNLVEQLLTLVRLEQSDVPSEEFLLNELVQEVVNEKLGIASMNNIALAFENQSSVSVKSNRELLRISLSNLIENAIKYTPANGRVIVEISTKDNSVSLAVIDTGGGIPEDKLKLVTEQFYRVPGNKQSGAGLGLAIVKRASELMGASLILHNGKTQGLEAVIQIPAP